MHLRAATVPFERPSVATGWWQITTSFGPCLALLAAIYAALPHVGIAALALTVPAGAFLVRIFIIQHDCGHGSFFPSERANRAVGRACSVLTWTPYAMWRRQHAGHHGHWNDLDARGRADLYSSCLTVAEYEAMTGAARLGWRCVQHPLVALGLLPPLIFLVLYRTPFDAPRSWRRERRGVHLTNAALCATYGGMAAWLGVANVALVQGLTILVASTIGVWLFAVQHRFAGARWSRRATWSATDAAVHGTSYLALPPLLNWITGNIGFHHVHHLNARVPNYRLAECHRAIEWGAGVSRLTLAEAATSWRFGLWDEEAGRLRTIADVSRGAARPRRRLP